MPSLFHRRDRSNASSSTVTEFGGNSNDGSAAPLGRTTSRPLVHTVGSSGRQSSMTMNNNISNNNNTMRRARDTLSPSSEQASSFPSTGSAGRTPPSPLPVQTSAPPPSTQSPTAAMHNIRSVSELLNARKVYRAGYIYRLDDEPSTSLSSSTSSNKAHFARYYVRLEDCILCLWSDEGLKRAQQEGKVIHPTSMNLVEGFVAEARGNRAWIERCDRYRAPTEHCFVLNTAGVNSLIFCCEDASDLRSWMNVIRLSIWERQRLETLYTGIRFGIKEEQQLSPIRSAISFHTHGAKLGRAEGLMDVRLPGDTEWKRVYAVLTEPRAYRAGLRTAAQQTQGQGQQQQGGAGGGGLNSPPIPPQPNKKEKRKSVLSGFFGGSSSSSSSKNDLAKEASSGNGMNADGIGATSPISSQYNQLLEDVQTGSTLALFGILSSPSLSGGPSQPNSPSRRNTEVNSSSSPVMSHSASGTSLAGSSSMKLTNRPVLVIDQIWSTYAVWPESEALIPHSKTFKLFGRVNWLPQEILAYSATAGNPQARQGVLHGFEESMRRENRDSGREGGEGQLLCMLVSSGGAGAASAAAEIPHGPGNAIRQAYKNDAGGELLSWVLGLYDAFQLHGRPDKLIYDQRHPLSPYFAQPIGPARGGLYFETALIEDLRNISENRPRAVSDQFSRILYERMNRLGALSPGVRMPNYLVDQGQSGGRQQQSGTSTPPVLPLIGEGVSQRSGRPTSPDRGSYSNSSATSGSPRITAGQLQAPTTIRERSASPLRSQSPPPPQQQQQQQQQQSGRRTPFETPPLASPRAVQQLARDDDLAESRELASQDTSNDSLSQAFDRALSSKSAAIGDDREEPSRSSTPRSQNHPTILRPGSASSSSRYGRQPSLDDIHQGRNGNYFDGNMAGAGKDRDGDGEGMYMAQGPHAQEMLGSPVAGAGRRDLPPSTREEPASAAAAADLSTSTGSGTNSTLEGHYNSFPVRSNTPSRASISSSSALSSLNATPSAMPGQYVATPSVNGGPTNLNGPPNTSNIQHGHAPLPQRSLSPPGGGGVAGNTQATSAFYTAGSPASQSRKVSSASTAPSARAAGQGMTPAADRGTMPSASREESILSDEPGALYALSLADEEDSQAASSVAVSRESSREGQQRQQQYPNHILGQMIQDRATRGGNRQTMDSPISGSDMGRTDSVDSRIAPASMAGERSGPPTRAGTMSSTAPNSAAPTSASAYSQAGTMRTYDGSASNGTDSGPPPPQAQAPGYNMAPMSHIPVQQEDGGLTRNLSVNSANDRSDAAVPENQNRQSKISSSSTAEGQDDYLAGLNYLALTADQEPAQPVHSHSSNNSSPPPARPPRSPRMGTGNKPVISVQTSSSGSSNNSHGINHPTRSGQAPESAGTMSPVEPLSPDPYGTYTEGANSVPVMHLVDSSPPKQQDVSRERSAGKTKATSVPPAHQRQVSAGAGSRKPGRRGVPVTRKSNKKLGSWSSDEEDEEEDKDSDAESREEDEQEQQRESQSAAGQDGLPQSTVQDDDALGQRRESTSSGGGSLRRNLPTLPGPSTDPYINQNATPSMMSSYGPGMMPYDDPNQYAQYPQNRNSMFGWPGQPQMGMMAPWQQPQMMGGNMSPYPQHNGGQGSGPNSPYGHSPSPSMYNMQQYQQQQQGMQPNTMIGQMGNESGGADGRATRNAAMAPHGLLQAGLADKHLKSAAQMEAMAKENGGPLVQIAAKPQGPQGGLVGAIANHERERKREGGIGATLTERERERRTAEARQREMDQMHARQGSFGGMPGGPAFPGFGAMPNTGMGGGFGGMDPAQMQQQMAMLAAQNAYLQAMAGFHNPGMQMGMGGGGAPSFMSPQYSPQPGFGGPPSHSPYAGSYLGMPQQQQPGSHGNSPLGHGRSDSSPLPHPQRGNSEYFRQ